MRKIIILLSIVAISMFGITAVALASPGDPYADAVIVYNEGPGVSNNNDNPNGALGAPEYNSTSGSGLFVSLGNGGSIELAFTNNVVVDGTGPDLRVIEVGGPENGDVYVSNDGGVTYTYLGYAYGQTSFDLLGTGLSFINAVKVVDLAPHSTGSPYAGFDLDAVIGLNSVDVLEVEIDIKPGSDPNSINLGSNGVIPVAILTTDDFDATTVDPGTVTLAGAGVAVRGKGNKSMSHVEDVDGDGDLDLLVQVETQNLDPDGFQNGLALLTGQTYGGQPIQGSDEIRIVPVE